jgi:hypothetical protein
VVPSRQGRIQLEHHLTGSVALHPFVRQRRAGDVAAQLVERLSLVGAAAHISMHVNPLMSMHTCLRSSSHGIAFCTVS